MIQKKSINTLRDSHTKIIATIGPASVDMQVLTQMARNGLSIVRMNMSHGSYTDHERIVQNTRKVQEETGVRLGLLQDLCGPKIRIGDFSTQSIELVPGNTFTITTQDVVGDSTKVSINLPNLHQEIQKGARILLNDGKNELLVMRVKGNDIITKVVRGGVIRGRRGVNLPDSFLGINAITEKDKKDLAWGIKQGVDYVAISFVRNHTDIIELKTLLKKHKASPRVIAKIETPQALQDMPAILEEVDAIMIARGDLGVEIGLENVPYAQKKIIDLCKEYNKPVIVATQMLDSMIHSSVPTRAEVADIAQAVNQGADAVMLSEESAMGTYPVQVIETMRRIASSTESMKAFEELEQEESNDDHIDYEAESLVLLARAYATPYIVTNDPQTAQFIASSGSLESIILIVSDETQAKHYHLVKNVTPYVSSSRDPQVIWEEVQAYILSHDPQEKGQAVIYAITNSPKEKTTLTIEVKTLVITKRTK